jgi:hypothetical protein
VATQTTTSVVTWTARLSDTLYAIAVADAIVWVPALRARTTVGLDPHTCATTDVISVTVGTEITYCYLITNTGGVPLTRYDVSDTAFNQEYWGITHVLFAETSLLFTVTALVTQSVSNTVTWTAYTTENFTATDRASAHVEALALLDVLAFYDVDRNNRRNDLEPGVAGVNTQLRTPTQETVLTNTNSNGQAIFTALPSGVYTVSVTAADLVDGYRLGADVEAQAITLTAAGVYTIAFALTQPLETDTDGDGIPDWQEGSIDRDFDGFADYEDITQMLYLAFVDD